MYSWMRLIWQSKMLAGSTIWPVAALSQSRKVRLGLVRGLAERFAKGFVVGERRELAQSAEIGHPAVADGLGDRCRASAGFASNSHLRGVTPLVLLLNRSGNISARSLTVVVRSRPV